MRALGLALAEREFRRRLETLEQVLVQYGEVGSQLREEGRSRKVVLTVDVPGYGFTREASMLFVEDFEFRGEGWALELYAYEYLREPRPSGRKAHHWHDGVFHIHCIDPEWPRSYDHFRGFPVGFLEAGAEFGEIHQRGKVDCFGLHPLQPE